ncbi:MAG: DUF721 domain-containing protein [Candidatus Shapirobacteria bacterium]|nr:DUF721 domain-containing protein [Candidatus Shapirobacteria bacterium]
MIKSFGALVKNKQAYLKKETAPEKETVFFLFKEVVRAEFGLIGAEKFLPNYFSAGTLFIKAQNSLWAAELWTNRNLIVRKINEKIGSSVVKEIKMK